MHFQTDFVPKAGFVLWSTAGLLKVKSVLLGQTMLTDPTKIKHPKYVHCTVVCNYQILDDFAFT